LLSAFAHVVARGADKLLAVMGEEVRIGIVDAGGGEFFAVPRGEGGVIRLG
jgi:hypothetical protein